MSATEPTDETSTVFDPDAFRMSIGDHLEELRWRIILAIIGLAVIATVCFCFGNDVLVIFCRPLFVALQKAHLNTQLHTTELDEGFIVWLKVNLITAAVLSGPWMVYQIWQFVAAGLYPNERKYVTKYMPLSISLMIAGVALVYFAVLPWTCSFFLLFTASVPMPNSQVTTTTRYTPTTVPSLQGNPPNPVEGEIWIDTTQGKIKIFFENTVRSMTFNTDSLLAPNISLSDYIDMVVGLVITFAIAFQMPLAVLALARIGIIEIKTLRKSRRYVYFSMSILAAVLAPHDVVTAQLALMFPLILLFELGIWLADRAEKRDLLDGN